MTPDFRIVANGTDTTGKIADRLISLELVDEDGLKADRMQLVLDDRDDAIEWPSLDAELEVSLGFKGRALTMIGRYAVDGISGNGGACTMTITAKAVDMKSDARAPRTRAWNGKKLSDIVRTIATEAGLTPVVSDSIASTGWAYLAQTAESNLHFLTRICAPLDATAKPAGGALVVQKRGEGKNAAGDGITAVILSRARLSRWRWDLGSRDQYACVEAEWGDLDSGEQKTVTIGSGKPKRRLRHLYPNEAEARRAAQGELDQGNRNALKLSAEVAGFEPALFAGGTVTITDLRAELAGEWQVTRVSHFLGAALTTQFEARKANS